MRWPPAMSGSSGPTRFSPDGPAVATARTLNGWAGLRPMTPDLLPIIGPDPDEPSLVYACGHSRNGVLLAPATGEVVAALIDGDRPAWDMSPFRIERFA